MMNLKTLRNEKDISQQKLASAIGSTQQSIHRYESGDYEPDIQTLSMLADFFDISIDFLVGRTDIRNKAEPVEQYDLNYEESSIVDEVRGLTPEYRSCIAAMIKVFKDASDIGKS